MVYIKPQIVQFYFCRAQCSPESALPVVIFSELSCRSGRYFWLLHFGSPRAIIVGLFETHSRWINLQLETVIVKYVYSIPVHLYVPPRILPVTLPAACYKWTDGRTIAVDIDRPFRWLPSRCWWSCVFLWVQKKCTTEVLMFGLWGCVHLYGEFNRQVDVVWWPRCSPDLYYQKKTPSNLSSPVVFYGQTACLGKLKKNRRSNGYVSKRA